MYLIDQAMGDDGPQGGVVEFEEQVAGHEVPDTQTAPGHRHRDPRRGGDAQGINGQLVLVNVPLLLEDVVQVPDLDAPVDGRGDDLIVGANHQGLDLDNPLEVGRHPLDHVPGLHVPHKQLLSDNKCEDSKINLAGSVAFKYCDS